VSVASGAVVVHAVFCLPEHFHPIPRNTRKVDAPALR
jgi:hypothetical protein